MIDGTKKMEEDVKDGRGYSSGIHMQDGNEDSENGPPKKKARLASGKTKDCKCGKKDHMTPFMPMEGAVEGGGDPEICAAISRK
jgi:hypothetical protein